MKRITGRDGREICVNDRIRVRKHGPAYFVVGLGPISGNEVFAIQEGMNLGATAWARIFPAIACWHDVTGGGDADGAE